MGRGERVACSSAREALRRSTSRATCFSCPNTQNFRKYAKSRKHAEIFNTQKNQIVTVRLKYCFVITHFTLLRAIWLLVGATKRTGDASAPREIMCILHLVRHPGNKMGPFPRAASLEIEDHFARDRAASRGGVIPGHVPVRGRGS